MKKKKPRGDYSNSFDRTLPGRLVSTRTNIRLRGALIAGVFALWAWKKQQQQQQQQQQPRAAMAPKKKQERRCVTAAKKKNV
jgi:hypothetical protein